MVWVWLGSVWFGLVWFGSVRLFVCLFVRLFVCLFLLGWLIGSVGWYHYVCYFLGPCRRKNEDQAVLMFYPCSGVFF